MSNFIEIYRNIQLNDMLEIDFESIEEISNIVNQLKKRLNKSQYSSLKMHNENNQIAFLTHVILLFSKEYPKILIDKNIVLQIKREIYIKYLLIF